MWLLLLNLIALCSLGRSDHHIDCGHPANITHGHFHWVTHEGDHTEHTVIKYECDHPGWVLDEADNGVYSCHASGTWTNRKLKEVLPKCHRVSCGDPHTIEHGHVDHLTNHMEDNYMSVLKYTCDQGYREEEYSEDGYYVCAHQGDWMNKHLGKRIPKCVPVHCGESSEHLDSHHATDHGEVVTRGAVPWGVLVRNSTGDLHNGVLLDHRWVLTSAHTLPALTTDKAAEALTVYVGVEDKADLDASHPYKVMAVVLEPRAADSPDFVNDIALLKLGEEVPYGNRVIPICLPPVDLAREGQEGTVTGWDLDHTSEDHHLTYVSRAVTPTLPCAGHFREHHAGLFPDDFHDDFCTKAVEHLPGDSERDQGSVFQVEVNGTAYAAGVLSYDDPGQGHDLAVYSNVHHHVAWIRDMMGHR